MISVPDKNGREYIPDKRSRGGRNEWDGKQAYPGFSTLLFGIDKLLIVIFTFNQAKKKNIDELSASQKHPPFFSDESGQ